MNHQHQTSSGFEIPARITSLSLESKPVTAMLEAISLTEKHARNSDPHRANVEPPHPPPATIGPLLTKRSLLDLPIELIQNIIELLPTTLDTIEFGLAAGRPWISYILSTKIWRHVKPVLDGPGLTWKHISLLLTPNHYKYRHYEHDNCTTWSPSCSSSSSNWVQLYFQSMETLQIDIDISKVPWDGGSKTYSMLASQASSTFSRLIELIGPNLKSIDLCIESSEQLYVLVDYFLTMIDALVVQATMNPDHTWTLDLKTGDVGLKREQLVGLAEALGPRLKSFQVLVGSNIMDRIIPSVSINATELKKLMLFSQWLDRSKWSKTQAVLDVFSKKANVDFCGWNSIVTNNPHLEYLQVCINEHAEHIEGLAMMLSASNALTTLNISIHHDNENALQHLTHTIFEQGKHLKRLNLECPIDLTFISPPPTIRTTSLTHLTIDSLPFNFDFFNQLAKTCIQLETLEAKDTRICDRSIASLSRHCKNLKKLMISVAMGLSPDAFDFGAHDVQHVLYGNSNGQLSTDQHGNTQSDSSNSNFSNSNNDSLSGSEAPSSSLNLASSSAIHLQGRESEPDKPRFNSLQHLELTLVLNTPKFLQHISPTCPNLTSLNLSVVQSGNSNFLQLDFNNAAHDFKFPSLKRLNISYQNDVTDKVLEDIVKQCPYITDLHLAGCEQLTLKALHILGELYKSTQSTSDPKSLEVLNVARCKNITYYDRKC
jgi:hypothetical protein